MTDAAAHLMKVCFHELEHNIDVFEFPWRGWEHDVLYLDNVCT